MKCFGIFIVLSFLALYTDAQLAPVYKSGSGSKPSKPKAQGPKSPPKKKFSGGAPTRFTTETVYGFIEFTTTVGSTVMVFTPKSDSDKKEVERGFKPTSSSKFVLRATPRPQFPRKTNKSQNTVLASPVVLQSSMTEPATIKTFQDLRKPTNVVTAVPAVPPPKKKKSPPTSRPFRFGSIKSKKTPRRDRKQPPRRQGPRERKQFERNYFKSNTQNSNKKVTAAPVFRPKTSKVAQTEVVVTAQPKFSQLSLIDRFANAIGKTNRDQDREDGPKQKLAINPNLISAGDGSPPTGLVTTLGGTIVNAGLTTVHTTSVIGTYIKGQYAQVLKSTSRIFQSSAVNKVNSGFGTVKSVIKGSATQFITPDTSTSLPFDELFSSPGSDRNARYENKPLLFKRKGQNNNQFKEDPFVDLVSEDDLQRSGTDLRPSFKPLASGLKRNNDKIALGSEANPSTFRPRVTPSSTFRFGGTRTAPPHRFALPRDRERERERNGKRPFIRRRPLANNNRPKLIGNRREKEKKKKEAAPVENFTVKPTPTIPDVDENGVETLHSHKSRVLDSNQDLWVEVATVRQMHTFRVGTKKNTRFVTYTRTFTHSIEPTVVTTNRPVSKQLAQNYQNGLGESSNSEPLFENILEKSYKDVVTLPPIDIGETNLNAILQTVTESYSTVETMLKTSVLPVIRAQLTLSHTLTQTYLITRVVTAIKTIPPVEAFNFIPENSLNEFNSKLLAEGTENEDSLLPSELEYDENSGTRVRPPPGFKNSGVDLAQIAGGNFNPEALDQKLNPQLAAALKGTPLLSSGQTELPVSENKATPQLSPEQLQQLAYLQLINPYAALGAGFNPMQPQMTVTSTPVTITTDVTTTTTRVLRVIFNARPIYTTLTSKEVVRTTLTTFEQVTRTASPMSPFGAFPFPGMPFAAG